MCNRPAIFDITLNSMNAEYTRLLEAARELRAWETPAEVARGLTAAGFTVSDQTMTNWKSRGIAALGILECARIIGCRTNFLRTGELPIADAKRIEPFSQVTLRAAEIIESMPLDEQMKILNYLQVKREQLHIQS